MAYRLNYSPSFLEDLISIGDYIEYQLFNPSAAARITNGIMDATEKLADYPEAGARVFLPGGMDSGYRYVRFEDYLAVYLIRQNEVFIARAVNSRQDYIKALFPFLRRGAEE